jgi:hypothetical protein
MASSMTPPCNATWPINFGSRSRRDVRLQFEASDRLSEEDQLTIASLIDSYLQEGSDRVHHAVVE